MNPFALLTLTLAAAIQASKSTRAVNALVVRVPMRRIFSQYSIGMLALAIGCGWVAAPLRAQSGQFYQVTTRGGVAWLLSPRGAPTLLLGLNRVLLITPSAPRTDLAPEYVDQRAAHLVSALEAAGFNTLGPDTDADLWHRGVPYTQTLELSRHLQADQQTSLVDVYAADYAEKLRALVEAACRPRAHDPDLVGYFSDDGLDWDPASHPTTALAYYLGLPLAAPGRQRATDFLRDRYHSDIAIFNRTWGIKVKDFIDAAFPAAPNAAAIHDAVAFANQVLLRYLQTASDAIHATDPNHLYLGASLGFAPATAASLEWNIPDVASVGLLPGQDPGAVLSGLQDITPHPLLLEAHGCDLPPASWRSMPGLAAWIGYVWSPSADWETGPCAAAMAAWAQINHAAAGAHNSAR